MRIERQRHRGERARKAVQHRQLGIPRVGVHAAQVHGEDQQVDHDAPDEPEKAASDNPSGLANVGQDEREHPPPIQLHRHHPVQHRVADGVLGDRDDGVDGPGQRQADGDHPRPTPRQQEQRATQQDGGEKVAPEGTPRRDANHKADAVQFVLVDHKRAVIQRPPAGAVTLVDLAVRARHHKGLGERHQQRYRAAERERRVHVPGRRYDVQPGHHPVFAHQQRGQEDGAGVRRADQQHLHHLGDADARRHHDALLGQDAVAPDEPVGLPEEARPSYRELDERLTRRLDLHKHRQVAEVFGLAHAVVKVDRFAHQPQRLAAAPRQQLVRLTLEARPPDPPPPRPKAGHARAPKRRLHHAQIRLPQHAPETETRGDDHQRRERFRREHAAQAVKARVAAAAARQKPRHEERHEGVHRRQRRAAHRRCRCRGAAVDRIQRHQDHQSQDDAQQQRGHPRITHPDHHTQVAGALPCDADEVDHHKGIRNHRQIEE
eukprot:ctg_476.g265